MWNNYIFYTALNTANISMIQSSPVLGSAQRLRNDDDAAAAVAAIVVVVVVVLSFYCFCILEWIMCVEIILGTDREKGKSGGRRKECMVLRTKFDDILRFSCCSFVLSLSLDLLYIHSLVNVTIAVDRKVKKQIMFVKELIRDKEVNETDTECKREREREY